jgi:hypothetical protein
MPSQTAAMALIELYFAVDGAPWKWPTWQKITGVHHGLFPEDDSHLLSGWTREDAQDVHSWFILCHSRSFDEGNTRAGALPGKSKWTRFVQSRWEAWQLHSIIVKELREHSVHPIQIVVNEGSMKEWPKSDQYVAAAIEPIGTSIFGKEAQGPLDLLPAAARRCITIFIQRSWTRIRDQVRKDKGRLDALESAALSAFARASPILLIFRTLITAYSRA